MARTEEEQARIDQIKKETEDFADIIRVFLAEHADVHEFMVQLLLHYFDQSSYGLTENQIEKNHDMFRIGLFVWALANYQSKVLESTGMIPLPPYLIFGVGSDERKIKPDIFVIYHMMRYQNMKDNLDLILGYGDLAAQYLLLLQIGKDMLNKRIRFLTTNLNSVLNTYFSDTDKDIIKKLINPIENASHQSCKIIQQRAPTSYNSIEDKFDEVLNDCRHHELVIPICNLKVATLRYVFSDYFTQTLCGDRIKVVAMADSILSLIQSDLSPEDIERFETEVQPLKELLKDNCNFISLIDAVIKAAISVSAGLAAGVVIGSASGALLTGAVVGTTVSLLAGSVLTYSGLSIWHRNEYHSMKNLNEQLDNVCNLTV